MNLVHTRFDEIASFCGSSVDPLLVSFLEKIDDDSLKFVTRIQAFVKAVTSRLDNSISYSPRVDQFLKIDCNNDEAWFAGLKNAGLNINNSFKPDKNVFYITNPIFSRMFWIFWRKLRNGICNLVRPVLDFNIIQWVRYRSISSSLCRNLLTLAKFLCFFHAKLVANGGKFLETKTKKQ